LKKIFITMKPTTTRPQTTFIYLFIILFFGVISARQSYGQQPGTPASTSLDEAVEAGVSIESLLIQPEEFPVIHAKNVRAVSFKTNERFWRNEAEDTRKKRRWWIVGGAAVLAATTTAILLSSGGGSQGANIPGPPSRP